MGVDLLLKNDFRTTNNQNILIWSKKADAFCYLRNA